MSKVAVQSWITLAKAHELFKDAGLDFDTLKKAALSRDFKPVPLHAKASFTIDNKVRSVPSPNVIAKPEGSVPALQDAYIIQTTNRVYFGRTRDRKRNGRGRGGADQEN